MEKLEVLNVIAATLWMIWSSSFMMVFIMRVMYCKPCPDPAKSIFFELRPIAPAILAVLFVYQVLTEGVNGWDAIIYVNDLAVWWYSRRFKDDDDRWKKRSEKVTGIVQSAGHKLVVVPTS